MSNIDSRTRSVAHDRLKIARHRIHLLLVVTRTPTFNSLLEPILV
jgi:hypothetical protein